nr:ABC transporter ATP-binding protein [Murinocardiopsis flavida]
MLRRLLRPHRPLAVLSVAALVLGTVAQLAGPPIIGRMVDLIVAGGAAAALVPPVALLAGLAVAQAVLLAAGKALAAQLGESVLAVLRERVMDRALRLPMGRVEQAGSGDVVARVSGDVSVIAKAVREAIPVFAMSGLTVLLTIAGLGALDWRLMLAGLCAVPIQAFALRRYLRATAPVYARERVAEGERAQQLLDSVGGAATVRAFGLSAGHLARVDARSRAAVGLALRANVLRTRFLARLNAAEYVGLAAILVVGFWLVTSDAVSIGTASAAALYFIALFNPINVLLYLFDTVQEAGAGFTRLVGVAEMPPPDDPAEPPAPKGAAVRVRAARYAYTPGHDVLHGVDLDVPAGARVALVGASGAGKTTLAKLAAGVHEPDSGTVEIGGVRLDALGPAATRAQVALVTQEVHVFAGPLAEDLRLARPDADDAALHSALDLVGADAWVRALPDGLDTVVGDGGHRLTATRAQQLALARLALADPPVAVLDEATAEAGSAGARVLEAAADRILAGRTAIVVVHRLTQAATADTVVVLDQGRVVETGTHAELLSSGGTYATLWSAWSTANTQAE